MSKLLVRLQSHRKQEARACALMFGLMPLLLLPNFLFGIPMVPVGASPPNQSPDPPLNPAIQNHGSGQLANVSQSPPRTTDSSIQVNKADTHRTSLTAGSPSQGFWVVDWGGTSNEWINSIAVGPDGSVYETGTTGSFCSNGCGILLKYSSTGVLQWAKAWNDFAPGGVVGTGVAISNDGTKVYVTGASWQTISGPTKGLLIQFDATYGSPNWFVEWSDKSSIAPNSVAVSVDGSVYVTGGNYSTISTTISLDGFLIKFNSAGSLAWSFGAITWRGPNAMAWGTAVTTDSANNAYVTGSVELGTVSATSLLKIKPGGSLVYQKYFSPNTASSIAEGLGLTLDGSALYVVGVDYSIQLTRLFVQNSSRGGGWGGGVSASYAGHAAISKVNPNDGSLVWRDEFNIGSFDAATAVAPAIDGGAYVVGFTNGPGTNFGKDSLFTMKMTASGQVSAQSEWSSAGTTDGWGAGLASDGGVYVGGSVDNPTSENLMVSAGTTQSVSVTTEPSLNSSLVLSTHGYMLTTPASYSDASVSGNTYYSGGIDATLLHFAVPTAVSVSANPSNAGNTSPSGTNYFFPGSQLNLVASPAGGVWFDRWDPGTAVSIPSAQLNSTSATATVLGSGTIFAYFYSNLNIGVTPGYCYTINPSPGGTQGNFCGNQVFAYHVGVQVSIIASSLQSGAAGVQIGLAESGALVSTDATNSSPPTTLTTSMNLANVDVSLTYLTSTQIPTMSFAQSGLPPGAQWGVSLTAYRLAGELWAYSPMVGASSSISFTGFVSNNYPYRVLNVVYNGCTYAASSSSGNWPVGRERVSVVFAAKSCNFTFTETGLPLGTRWSVVLGSTTQSSTTNTITFTAQPPKQTQYAVNPSTVTGCKYTPTPTSGNVSPPSLTTISVAFSGSCTIVFSESGLPQGTLWSATLDTKTLSSTGNTISFNNMSPTTHTWSVSSPSGSAGSKYFPAPSGGSITAPSTTTVQVQYTQEWYATFTESGFSGTWSVTFAGTVYTSASNQILTGYYPAGTYSWSASYPSCGSACQYSPSPPSGPVSIPTQLSQSITYSNQFLVYFAVSPANSGGTVPSGPVWATMGSPFSIKAIPDIGSGYTFSSWTSGSSSITIACPTCASTTATVVSTGSGTLTANFKAYFSMSLSPNSGSTVQGGSLTSTVALSLLSGSPYPVTLSASGLPTGVSASFTNNPCTPACSSTMTLSTSGSTPIGTYTVTITGTDTNGVAVTAAYSLTVTQGAYTITFTETGLPSGTSWSVIFNGVQYSSSSSTITFTEPGGTYNWSVTNPVSGGTAVQYFSSYASGVMGVPGTTSQAISYTLQYSVTLAASPSAGGTTSPAGLVWVGAGGAVSISASPNSGYQFSSWSSSTGSIAGFCPSCSSTSATVNGPGTITANFATVAQTFWVSFSESGLGGSANWCVSLGQFGQQCLPPGSNIVFYGVPAGSYSYSVSYVGCGTGCQYAPSPPSGTVSVSGNTNVPTIGFNYQFFLTMLSSGAVIGDTASPGSGWYNAGTPVTISANAGGTCSTFMSWTGSSGGYSGTSISATITMNQAITETANFKSVC